MLRALMFAVAVAVSLEPVTAAHVVAYAHGRPGLADGLVEVCRRESRCLRIGPHKIDADLDPSDGYRGQVRLGHLRPWCQRYRENAWHTRGAFGLSAASHHAYLFPCYPPEILDVPLVSAWVAARKMLARCSTSDRARWCPRRARRPRRPGRVG